MPLGSLYNAFDTQTVSLGSRGNGRGSTVHAYDMCNVLYVCYSTSTCIPLCRYNDFPICLGMVCPMQVDGIWDKRHFAYNKYMASLPPREIYCCLQRLLRTDVTDLIEECNATWSAAWEIGGAVFGDEAVVPHSGGRRLGLRQYIARKPHSTGIKLCVLADNGGGYVFDVYLYTGRRGKVRRFGSCCGKYEAKGIMCLWARMIPQSTVLCADSFFGSHGHAEEFAAQRRLFLMLSRRDKRDAGLTRAAALTQEGNMARAIVADKNYELAAYKNPKVGHKPPRLVPFLTKCWYGEEVPKDRRGNPLSTVVACYQALRCRRWGQPNGAANAPAGEANDLEPRCAYVHVAVRGRQCLCHRQGIGIGGRQDHHVGIPMGHPQPAVLYRCGVQQHNANRCGVSAAYDCLVSARSIVCLFSGLLSSLIGKACCLFACLFHPVPAGFTGSQNTPQSSTCKTPISHGGNVQESNMS